MNDMIQNAVIWCRITWNRCCPAVTDLYFLSVTCGDFLVRKPVIHSFCYVKSILFLVNIWRPFHRIGVQNLIILNIHLHGDKTSVVAFKIIKRYIWPQGEILPLKKYGSTPTASSFVLLLAQSAFWLPFFVSQPIYLFTFMTTMSTNILYVRGHKIEYQLSIELELKQNEWNKLYSTYLRQNQTP